MRLADWGEPMALVERDGFCIFRIHSQPGWRPMAGLAVIQRCAQKAKADTFTLMAGLYVKCGDFGFRVTSCWRFLADPHPDKTVYADAVLRDQEQFRGLAQYPAKFICSEFSKGVIGKEAANPLANVAVEPNFDREGSEAGAIRF